MKDLPLQLADIATVAIETESHDALLGGDLVEVELHRVHLETKVRDRVAFGAVTLVRLEELAQQSVVLRLVHVRSSFRQNALGYVAWRYDL